MTGEQLSRGRAIEQSMHTLAIRMQHSGVNGPAQTITTKTAKAATSAEEGQQSQTLLDPQRTTTYQHAVAAVTHPHLPSPKRDRQVHWLTAPRQFVVVHNRPSVWVH